MNAAPRRLGGPSASSSGSSSVKSFAKSLYYDEFRWSLVKSCGLFIVGVYLAKEFKGVDLMAQQQP